MIPHIMVSSIDETEEETEMRTWDQMTELEQLACTYSDMHKDAYGSRPRGAMPRTVEEYRVEMDTMQKIIEADIAREAEEQAADVRNFEAYVETTMTAHGCDRQRAIEYIMEAEECNGDSEYLCYRMNLPYDYFRVAA